MNRLQALRADREFCVTLNRTEAIDPAKVIRTIAYAHPVFTPRRRSARRRATTRSAARNRTHFCGAYWGWGFHEDGVVSAAARRRALRGAPMTASAIYEGTIRHRRFAAREHEFTLPASRWPTSTWTSCRSCSAAALAARPARPLRRADYLGDPAVPLATRCATSSRSDRRAPAGPDAPAHAAALVRPLLQPRQLLLLLRPAASACRPWSPR